MKLVHFILFIVATLLSLFISEIICRVLFIEPDRIAAYYPFAREIAGAEISLEQREFAVKVNYNQFGFRERHFTPPAKQGEVRVLVVGDSFTEGQGVEESQRFTNRLEERLNQESSLPHVVINAGQIATQPRDYLENIARFGLSLKPTLVVFSLFTGNDFMGGRLITLPIQPEIQSLFPGRPSRWWDTVGSVASLHYLRGLINQNINQRDLPEKKQRFVRRTTTDRFWDVYYGKKISRQALADILGISPEEFERCTEGVTPDVISDTISGLLNPAFLGEAIQARCPSPEVLKEKDFYIEEDFNRTLAVLDKTAQILAEREIPLLIAVLPDLYDIAPETQLGVLHHYGLSTPPQRLIQAQQFKARLIDYLEKHQFNYIDFTTPLKTLSPPGYHPFDSHFNAQGHEVVAEGLYQRLREVRER